MNQPKCGNLAMIFNRDNEKLWFAGIGVYLGRVKVYFLLTPNNELVYYKNDPEQPLPAAMAQQSHCEIKVVPDQPKFQVSNGRIVYGFEVRWWLMNLSPN